jgi:conjugative transfer signal peptidase TraF
MLPRHVSTIALALTIAVADTILIGVGRAGFRINATSSMPLGLWRAAPAPAPLARGMTVMVCLPASPILRMALGRGYIGPGQCPGASEPLLKPIAALAGDTVRATGTGIAVNGEHLPRSAALAHDGAGRILKAVPSGTYRVGQSQMWLVAPAPDSFDSRYFGPVPVSAIQGIARPVWLFP